MGQGMRISGGLARGVVLKVPQGDFVRPATDGMRQAVFSSIAPRLSGARFVDLFAGSGAYGLEALSRGAAAGVFVEKHNKAATCLRENLAIVAKCVGRPATEMAKVMVMDATTAPLLEGGVPDLVFIDPPYDVIEEIAPGLFERLSAALPVAVDPLVLFEMPGETELTIPGWTCVKRLGKGRRQPSVCYFKRTENA